ncbi:MAG: hypothetical protein PHU71_04285 [Candidatus Gracilibacteria bacterium]|nr:hypothetical protein [Candidatus Gracilibacteria bacterium]
MLQLEPEDCQESDGFMIFRRNKDNLISIEYVEILDIANYPAKKEDLEMVFSAMRNQLKAILSRLGVKQKVLPDVEYALWDKNGKVLSRAFVPGNYWKSPQGQACDPLQDPTPAKRPVSSKQSQPTVIIRKADITQ